MPHLNKWELFQLPSEMEDRSFLDVGCWEGHRCVDAVLRKARRVTGIDMCTSQDLRRNVERYRFQFIQLDIFSEKFLELDTYDVVLCSGVLYHVENVISLLVRLRKVTREILVLETVTHTLVPDRPLLLFHQGRDLAGNPSNWWTPNEACLMQMLETCGFTGIRVVHRKDAPDEKQRVCIHALPADSMDYRKILPRKEELMSLYGGDRPQRPVLAPTSPSSVELKPSGMPGEGVSSKELPDRVQ